ncbi:MAG: hypothetical protein KGQ59_10385 [Bdellovibrionales bacterium]|nr:hypothetical protein [Bdellovibrionales bacterium]
MKLYKPTLAVRGADCLLCHSQIKSNIITDFGAGNDWRREGDSFYQHEGWNKFENVFEGDMTVIPRSLGANSKYLYEEIANQVPRDKYKVVERESVYIGAPTVDEIQALQSKGSLQPVTKLEENGKKLAHLKGSVDCQGDIVFKDAALFIENLNLRTGPQGCRLYVSGNVFIQGKVTYSGEGRSLQITSADGIYMGLSKSTILGRRSNYRNNKGFSRDAPNVSAVDAKISRAIEDATFIHSRLGLYDANEGCSLDQRTTVNCDAVSSRSGTSGRAIIHFTGLLLNAPWINSRYLGDFEGALIAEVALFSLGNFDFQSSPAFTSGGVPLFPLLKKPILHVNEK